MSERSGGAGARGVLALGSNLAPREAWLDLGHRTLLELGAELLAKTPRWNTEPVGGPAQPDYLNQLLLVRVQRSRQEWLELCREVERRAGRRRGPGRGPRTLDVDVILLEEGEVELAELRVPHPALRERPYLLRGSALLVPHWPGPEPGRTVAETARQSLSGPWRLEAPRGAAGPRARG
ncbi:MAG: 2-amino-4-hydroxy-6-hydroxymethyldihydropteridine diphosphokinase [Candidatus Dormibacteria bacterium]